uniref:NTP_transf_2 domain-containing protein n=1 Tax=Globodera pallida TaxID=36090 RepID=A0A183CC63_GLOPA
MPYKYGYLAHHQLSVFFEKFLLKLHAQIRPVVADLERAVCASGKRSRLVLIGSIASGMAFDESADINLAFFYAGDTQQQREQFMEDFCGATTALSPFRRAFMEAIAVALENFLCRKAVRLSHDPAAVGQFGFACTGGVRPVRQRTPV